jgi:hypothetical protein
MALFHLPILMYRSELLLCEHKALLHLLVVLCRSGLLLCEYTALLDLPVVLHRSELLLCEYVWSYCILILYFIDRSFYCVSIRPYCRSLFYSKDRGFWYGLSVHVQLRLVFPPFFITATAGESFSGWRCTAMLVYNIYYFRLFIFSLLFLHAAISACSCFKIQFAPRCDGRCAMRYRVALCTSGSCV